jgi:hypothetical protein
VYVGCTTSSVFFTDNPSLITLERVDVGTGKEGRYPFALPVSTRSWCVPQQYEILNPDSTTWTGTALIVGNGPTFDLYSTYTVETIPFRVKTYYLNSFDLVSSVIEIEMFCGIDLVASILPDTWENESWFAARGLPWFAADPPTSQFVTHELEDESFSVPLIETITHQGECPVVTWEISSTDDPLTDISAELFIETTTPLMTLVKPVNPALHHDYTFYLKATISGGISYTFFGPWVLSVGCTQ